MINERKEWTKLAQMSINCLGYRMGSMEVWLDFFVGCHFCRHSANVFARLGLCVCVFCFRHFSSRETKCSSAKMTLEKIGRAKWNVNDPIRWCDEQHTHKKTQRKKWSQSILLKFYRFTTSSIACLHVYIQRNEWLLGTHTHSRAGEMGKNMLSALGAGTIA